MNTGTVHNHTLSEAGIEWCFAKARRSLRDARDSRLSPSRRYQCAYDAALQCALAFAAATNNPIAFEAHSHRAVFVHLLNGLSVAATVWYTTTVWVNHQYLARQLGPSVTDEAVAECATRWAALLHAATAERLTKRRGVAQL